MRRRAVLPILLVPALSLGCTPDRNPTGNDDASSDTEDTASGDTENDESDDDPTTSAGTTAPTTTGVDESSSSGMPTDGPVLARGITLAGIYANQGVEVALV